ncbi:hypothetical protein C8R43DRAFT_1199327 [Mycena crocata]|nr:hypothetical protein C8R43DRAFT_1199327 [Mycena crocata]
MSTIPQLPVELMEKIIFTAWHLPLTSEERITLIRSSALVNFTWADIFDLISSRDVYIPSSAFCDHFLQRLRVQSPEVPAPSYIGSFLRHFRKPTKITQRPANLACQSISIRIANVDVHPDKNGRMRLPMGAVLDELLENLDAHALAPNLRRLTIDYLDAGFDDVFQRAGLAALPSQITTLELHYSFSADVPAWLIKALQEKQEKQRHIGWISRSVTNLFVSGAGENTVRDIARACPNAQAFKYSGPAGSWIMAPSHSDFARSASPVWKIVHLFQVRRLGKSYLVFFSIDLEGLYLPITMSPIRIWYDAVSSNLRFNFLDILVSCEMRTELTDSSDSGDPCALAAASTWVSSEIAHACELTVPFNKTSSLAIVDTAIKSLPYYSLETWFLRSPNPLIPHDVNIRALLQGVQHKVSGSGYHTDWDFNIAVTDAYAREQDGHTIYVADCTAAFSWNLPFSISTLADTPFDRTAFPTFLVNYDFPNQNRSGLEAYFEGIGVFVRPYDGARVLTINGVEAEKYLTDLADASSIYDGLVGGYEILNTRFVRLMSRYSADSDAGLYTQEIGRFGQRTFFPGADQVIVRLQTANGIQTVAVPWAATFIGKGNTTASFVAKTCLLSAEGMESRTAPRLDFESRRKAVTAPDAPLPIRAAGSAVPQDTPDTNYVQPNRGLVPVISFGHFITLDIYQLKQHPKVGVVYFEQFEPTIRYDYRAYFDGISDTLFTGLTALKKAGVKHILIDISGNRGGYIMAGAIAIWSLWPLDPNPGFPAVYRINDLIKRESDIAAAKNDTDSEYFYGNYLSEKYKPFTSNKQFMDPPVSQTVNGAKDAYSHPFLDNFGTSSKDATSFTAPPFANKDYVLVSNSICASTCSIFSSYLFQKHGVRSAVFGGTPNSTASQFDGGVKGSEVTGFDNILFELENAGLQNETAAPQPFPIRASLTLNFRNAIPYKDKKNGILEYVWEQGTKKYQFTRDQYNDPQKIWEFVAEEFFGKS